MAMPTLIDASDRLTDATLHGDPRLAAVGTVTSVDLAAPAEFTVSGNPVTSSGTITIGKDTQTANTVWAGPTTGAAAEPAFRALVADDVPATLNDTDLARVTTGGGTWSLQGTLDASVRDTTRGVEVVVGSNAAGEASGAAAVIVEKFLDADITVDSGHVVEIISKKVGGTGTAFARSGALNLTAVDSVGWGGVGAQSFCEGLHSKTIAAWSGAGKQGSIQAAVLDAIIDTANGPTDFGFVNVLEVRTWNKVKDAGARTWATLNGSWPSDFSVGINVHNATESTQPCDAGIIVGNGYAEKKFYNGIIVRDGTIETGGYIFRSTPFAVSLAGNVTLGNGAAGTDAGYPLGLIASYSSTNDIQVVQSLSRRTTGTAAAGMGLGERIELEDSGGTSVQVFQSNYEWIDPTPATRACKWSAFVIDAGASRTLWVAASDGSQPLLGFYGNAAVARQTVTGRGDAAVTSIAAALDNLGLVTDSTTAGDFEGEKTLTESADTPFVDIAVASNSAVGGECLYTVEANDSTDFQMRSGRLRYTAVNKAGTLTLSCVEVGTQDYAVSTGTLSVTNTIIAATNSLRLRCNAVSSLTQTTLRIRYRIMSPYTTTTVTAL